VITHASAEYTPENSGLIPSVRLGINGDHFAYTILLPAPVEIRYSYLQATRHIQVGQGNTLSMILGGQFVSSDEITAPVSIVGTPCVGPLPHFETHRAYSPGGLFRECDYQNGTRVHLSCQEGIILWIR
jgi:hypothetical protein